MPYLASRRPPAPQPKPASPTRKFTIAVLPVVICIAIVVACLLWASGTLLT